MTSRGRRFAALLAVVPTAVAATILTVAAGPAQAATTDLGCRIYFSDEGTGTSPSTYTDTFTWTQSGDVLSLSGSVGTKNGPVGLNANQLTVRVIVEWSGGTATLVSGGYPAAAKAANQFLGPWTATGSVSAPDGAVLTVKQLRFDDGSVFNVDTYCSAVGDRDHKAAPVATALSTTAGATSTTTTSTPPPTTTTSTPPPTTTASTPPPTTSTSTTPPPTTSTPPTSVTPVAVSGLNCEIIGSVKAWIAPATKGDPDASDPEFSFGADKLSVKTGDKVSFTLTYNQGPAVGPVTIPAGALTPKAKVTVTGGGGGTAVLKAPTNTQPVTGYAAGNSKGWIPGNTMTGSWTATAEGTITAVFESMSFDYGDAAAGTTPDWPTKVDDLDSVCNKGAKPKSTMVTIGLQAQQGSVATSTPPVTTPPASTATDDGSGDGSGNGSTDSSSEDSGNNGTLADTGPGEAFQAMIWALVALQAGLIIVVRMARRRPATVSASSGRAARRSSQAQPWARPRGRHR